MLTWVLGPDRSVRLPSLPGAALGTDAAQKRLPLPPARKGAAGWSTELKDVSHFCQPRMNFIPFLTRTSFKTRLQTHVLQICRFLSSLGKLRLPPTSPWLSTRPSDITCHSEWTTPPRLVLVRRTGPVLPHRGEFSRVVPVSTDRHTCVHCGAHTSTDRHTHVYTVVHVPAHNMYLIPGKTEASALG